MGSEKITLTFKVYKDDVLVGEQQLDQQAVKIGRLNTHHIALDDDAVAMTHAVIQVMGTDVSLFSLDSDHPTLVNGEPVNKCKLASGDILTVGPYRLVTEFVVHGPRAMAAAKPPAARPRASAGLQAAATAALPGMGAVPGMPVPAPAQGGMTEAERTAAAARLVDLDTIEDRSHQVLEVISVWQNTVLNVKHLTGKSPDFTIGEEPSCDFWVPAEKIGGSSKVTIAASSTVHCHDFLEGQVTLESGDQRAIEGDYAVPEDARCRLSMGDVTFLVNSVPGPRTPKLPFVVEWSYHSFNGVSMLAVFVMLMMVFFFPPNSKWISLSTLSNASAYSDVLFEPMEKLPDSELPEWFNKKDKQDEKEGGRGERHKGDEGQMGDIKAKKTDNMYGIKGPKDYPDPHMARDQKKDLAKGAGILSVLDQTLNMPTSPFGRNEAMGNDAANALGALMGTKLGPNFGFGGLGLIGTGSGGGGTGEGTIGLGHLGTIGHGAGGGPGVGYGLGDGGLHGHGPGKVPPPKITGHAEVKGCLSKEAIRRVIRQHLNEVRFCYEQGLSTHPDLSGRVTVAFIIANTGAIQTASLHKSSLGNGTVETCIVKAVRRWTFPQPECSMVLVKYPFMLQPAGKD